MIKESQIYLRFLKSFWWLFLALPIIGAVVGGWYGTQQPRFQSTNIQMEIEHDPQDLVNRTLIADEVVGVLRSKAVQSELGIAPESRVIVHKNGPLLVDLVVESLSLSISNQEAFRLRDYVVDRYEAQTLGTDFGEGAQKVTLYILIGTGLGLVLALFIALIKTYLSNH